MPPLQNQQVTAVAVRTTTTTTKRPNLAEFSYSADVPPRKQFVLGKENENKDSTGELFELFELTTLFY